MKTYWTWNNVLLEQKRCAVGRLNLKMSGFEPRTLHLDLWWRRWKWNNSSSWNFDFPLSVAFYNCSILIHSSTTHAVQCFSPSTLVFPCQYHSTIAPYSFIHLPPTLYNVFLPVLQFFPVSIIPPLLHTHSFIYHSRCIMFFSQYFSFPLSVSFHHCSILIHSSNTHAV